MSGPNHIIGGIVFTGIYMSMFDKNIFSQPHFLFFTAFFSVLPDIDHTKSNIGKVFYPIAKYLDRKYGHRTITHSLACYIALALLVALTETVTSPSGGGQVGALFIWSYGSHLIFDMMTLQGVPLFYPFKKNPCVIPGNPSFRFRSSDLKTEMIIFGIFIALGFSCLNLFRYGFWNTYNRTFNTIKHVFAESMIYEKALQVRYDLVQQGQPKQGRGWLIAASTERLLLFDSASGFVSIEKADKCHLLQPNRTSRVIRVNEMRFANITPDSLQRLLYNKPLQSLKLQALLPLQYSKDNKPQSGTSIELEHVYNPAFQSSDVDSIDQSVQKEIGLLGLDIARNVQEINAFKIQQAQCQQELAMLEDQIHSPDLAIREQAIRRYQQTKTQCDNLRPPINQQQAYQLRLQYLQSQLHVRKAQRLTGYLSYYSLH